MVKVKFFGLSKEEIEEKLCKIRNKGENISWMLDEASDMVVASIKDNSIISSQAGEELDRIKKIVEKSFSPFVIGYNENSLESKIVELLLKKKETIATVESCTGGMLAQTLVNCEGISACFGEGVVTYSNAAKMKYVHVQAETLDRFGAVSEETAREMAEGIRQQAKATIGLSTTGIAGPGGGTPEKPVGLVYIGIATPIMTQVYKLQLEGTRQEVREQTVKHILFELYKLIR